MTILDIFVYIMAIAVMVVYLAGVIYWAVKAIKAGKVETEAVLPLFLGAFFVLLVVSLCILLKSAGSDSPTANVSVTISLISLTITLAAVVPYLVTRALTEKNVNDMVTRSIETHIKPVRDQFDVEVKRVKKTNVMVDSDLSRMIGYLLCTSENPNYIWSASWTMRSLFNYIEHCKAMGNLGEERKLNKRFITINMSILIYDFRSIAQQLKTTSDLFDQYDMQSNNALQYGLPDENNTRMSRRLLHQLMSLNTYMNNTYLSCRVFALEDNKYQEIVLELQKHVEQLILFLDNLAFGELSGDEKAEEYKKLKKNNLTTVNVPYGAADIGTITDKGVTPTSLLSGTDNDTKNFTDFLTFLSDQAK